MRREVADLVGSGLLLAALVAATIGVATQDAVATTDTATADTHVAGPATVERGRSLFYAKGCVSCHTKERSAVVNVGPSLVGLADRAATRREGVDAGAYVHESIKTPSAYVVPGYGSVAMPDLHLTDDEIDALVAFLLGTP